jgi:UPF0755 protein
MKKVIIALSVVLIFIIGSYYFNLLKSVDKNAKEEVIIIKSESIDGAIKELENAQLIRSFTAFNLIYKILGNKKIESGGYYLSKSLNSIQIIKELNNGPDLKSITIPEGLRKEQIGERLAKLLNWNDKQLEEWNNIYSENNIDYIEGVYFPDTYLIPVIETPTLVANRMIANFNEQFKPYSEEALEKNIKWTTVLKIASLIQREAAGESDMKLISGVIWNRLNAGSLLQLDATIQYAKGKVDGQWWSQVTGEDIKNIDSAYNNYKYKGLPPTPISNFGVSAIDAALNPEETDCFYYLHDRSRQVHCSITYEEHLENIEKYLN